MTQKEIDKILKRLQEISIDLMYDRISYKTQKKLLNEQEILISKLTITRGCQISTGNMKTKGARRG